MLYKRLHGLGQCVVYEVTEDGLCWHFVDCQHLNDAQELSGAMRWTKCIWPSSGWPVKDIEIMNANELS